MEDLFLGVYPTTASDQHAQHGCGPPQSSKPKKAKLSDDFAVDDNVLGKSPVLQHKIPSRPRTDQDSQESENSDDRGQKTNMFGVKYVMWFEVGIEGKQPMDQEELNLDFVTRIFPRN